MKLLTKLKREENYFWEALAASAALHVLLFNSGGIKLPERRRVEIDITNMGRMGAPAAPKLAPARAHAPPKPVAPPREWTKAAPNRRAEPAPIPTKPVAPQPEPAPPAPRPETGTGEIGVGTGEGGEARLARLPQLLNLSDLAAIQRRFYPEKAREDGREATVVLDIHIGPDGRVSAVEVVQSADRDFEQAAIHVAQLLRFSPAYVANAPVAVKMRQAIQFKLER